MLILSKRTNTIKKGVFVCVFFVLCMVPMVSYGSDYLVDFAGPLTSKGGYGDESAFSIEGLSDDNSFIDNMKKLFWPDFNEGGGELWKVFRNLAVGLLILLFIWAGAYLMLYGSNPDDLKTGLLNLLYLIVGAVVLFLALRFLSEGLDFGGFSGLSGSTGESIIEQGEQKVLKILLAIVKGVAFFAAIIFIVYYGYRMMTAFDAEDKQKAAKQGILNVILALIFIKIIDYIYFITIQGSFKSDAIELVVGISKALGYVLGIVLVVMMIYAGYMMITANGNEDQVKKAKNIIRSIFIAILILMLFLLIIYQIFNDVLA